MSHKDLYSHQKLSSLTHKWKFTISTLCKVLRKTPCSSLDLYFNIENHKNKQVVEGKLPVVQFTEGFQLIDINQ